MVEVFKPVKRVNFSPPINDTAPCVLLFVYPGAADRGIGELPPNF
ncbi:hypothetical protein [Bradyrhizobium sp. 25ACV]